MGIGIKVIYGLIMCFFIYYGLFSYCCFWKFKLIVIENDIKIFYEEINQLIGGKIVILDFFFYWVVDGIYF